MQISNQRKIKEQIRKCIDGIFGQIKTDEFIKSREEVNEDVRFILGEQDEPRKKTPTDPKERMRMNGFSVGKNGVKNDK